MKKEKKRVVVDVAPETHRRLKIEAAKVGKSVGQVLRELIDQWLSKR